MFYGCKTWSVTLSEELRLRLFENNVLIRIFGPERERERERKGGEETDKGF
jgi:hypothetical protein